MRAVIPVAGVGTRLRPHTYALPKVLLNVAGKPILAHILDVLMQYSIDNATIITGYMGELIEEFVKKRYSAMNVDFVEQKERKGLGHAIWTGKETYKNDEPLLIILGDTVFDVNLSNVLLLKNNSIGVKSVEDPRRFGIVIMDNDRKINGNPTVSKFIEKPENPVSNLAIVGMYYIANSSKLVESLDKLIEKNIKTKEEYQLTDALQIMLDEGENFTTFPVEGWYDCGKPETLLSTNRFLLDKYPLPPQLPGTVVVPPCFIAKNAIVENSIIGPYASIAANAVVKDSIVKNSIVSYSAKVIQTLLNESIIGNEAEVYGKFTKLNVGNSSTLEFD